MSDSFYVTYLTFRIENLQNDLCKIVVYLCENQLDINDVKNYEFYMSGEEYNNYKQDDVYLINWLCDKSCAIREGTEILEMNVPSLQENKWLFLFMRLRDKIVV
jgi:hypothetical protein